MPAARPHRRSEDLRFLVGEGGFVADLAKDALRAAFARSIEPHAELLGVDVSRVATSPGVLAAVTGADLELPDIPGDSIAVAAPGFPRPHLATQVVRYVGEPVAAVVAVDEASAMDGAELVDVEYRPLPAVVDPRQARSAEILLHPGAGTNVVEHHEMGVPAADGRHEVEAEVEVRNQRLAPLAIEPLGILCAPEDDGRLLVVCGHQRAHSLRKELAPLLGMEEEQLHVVVPDIGGSFGMKGKFFPEYTVVAAMALRLGRPVAWLERRREHFSGGTHGRGAVHRVRLLGTAGGRIERAEIEILAEVGAYPHNGASVPAFSRQVATGPYDIRHVRLVADTVVTNLAPTGSYRGAGRPEAAYAMERAIDAFAAAAGLDPVEVRLQNLIPSSALPFRTPTGSVYDSGDYARALRMAVELVELEDLRTEQARRRADGGRPLGVGFGAFVERAGGGPKTGEFARVAVAESGGVTILTGSISSGQGHETVWGQVAAEALGIDGDSIRVSVVSGDTDLVPRGGGTGASRSAQLGASAVWKAASAVRARACEFAAEMLECAPEDVVIQDGCFGVAGAPGVGVEWAEVAREAAARGEELSADEWFVAGAQTFPYGVHVAVVEVDPETGELSILRLVAVDDCGRVLNPMIVEGQMHGSLAQGVGQALYEGIEYSSTGQLLTATMLDYPIPHAADMPPLHLGRLATAAPSNPLGVKGTGEAGCIGAPPAIVNAVLDALRPYGITHLDMPLRPARIWHALREARAAAG